MDEYTLLTWTYCKQGVSSCVSINLEIAQVETESKIHLTEFQNNSHPSQNSFAWVGSSGYSQYNNGNTFSIRSHDT